MLGIFDRLLSRLETSGFWVSMEIMMRERIERERIEGEREREREREGEVY